MDSPRTLAGWQYEQMALALRHADILTMSLAELEDLIQIVGFQKGPSDAGELVGVPKSVGGSSVGPYFLGAMKDTPDNQISGRLTMEVKPDDQVRTEAELMAQRSTRE